MRVLILTPDHGGGHVSLAEALCDRLGATANVTIADPLPRITQQHYRLVSRHALWVWAAEFHASNTPARAAALHRLFAIVCGPRLRALAERSRPDLVISSSAVLTDAAVRALARGGRRLPFVTLIADAEQLHATWLTARAPDLTLAPTRESYREALDAGIPASCLHLTGWPVRAQFLRPQPDRTTTLARLRLDPALLTVFVQGGGEGAAHVGRAVERVLAAGATQVILAAGANRALIEHFGGAERVRVLPFTREIAPLMAAADLVMGKAGPNALFESVALGKPFVATTYIRGQETGNLAMIRRYGLGWVALEPRDQSALLASLVEHPARLAEMTTSVERYRRWNVQESEAIGPLLRQLVSTASQSYVDFNNRPLSTDRMAGGAEA